jgi:hypothetical protein
MMQSLVAIHHNDDDNPSLGMTKRWTAISTRSTRR